jgi:hypothetical protein
MAMKIDEDDDMNDMGNSRKEKGKASKCLGLFIGKMLGTL